LTRIEDEEAFPPKRQCTKIHGVIPHKAIVLLLIAAIN